MRFSIVTPSYRSSSWLKLCVASVADQGVEAEHIVQDAVSDDGTLDWLPGDPRVRSFVEKDNGMYDAINRGLARCSGEILAYLNCDEQYLPGTLQRVEEFFQRNPGVDMVFGDVIIVNNRGDYCYHRKMQTPLLYHTWTCHLSTLSCGMFFRKKLVAQGPVFNSGLRDVGDGEWMVQLLRRKARMKTLETFTSVFALTGANMSAGTNAKRENRELFESAPRWARTLRPLLMLQHRLRRLFGGMYCQRPFSYSIYTRASERNRVEFQVSRPRSRQ